MQQPLPPAESRANRYATAWLPDERLQQLHFVGAGAAHPARDALPRERRREPRQAKAFAFWIRRRNGERSSAWMLDMATSGAAFLVPADQLPAVGERLELLEMPIADPLVREDAGPLPRAAVVLRLDPGDGPTRRVAARFECPVGASDNTPRERVTSIARPPIRTRRPPPPVPADPWGQIRPVAYAAGV